jgi:hypothetical protein
VVTEGKPLLTPSFEAGLGVWYPDLVYDFSSTGEGEEHNDQLLVTPAQYKAVSDSETTGTEGTMWIYQEMRFKVLYIDPTADEEDDYVPPIINEVRVVRADTLGLQAGIDLRMIVKVRNPDGGELPANAVQAVYSNDTENWQSLDLTRVGIQEDGTERWVVDIPAGSSLSYIITAHDSSGNVSYYNGKGELSAPEAKPVQKTTAKVAIEGSKQVDVGDTVSLTGTMAISTSVVSQVTLPLSYTWAVTTVKQVSQGRVLSLDKDVEKTTDNVFVHLTHTFVPTQTGIYTVGLSVGNMAEPLSLDSQHTVLVGDVIQVEPTAKEVVYLPMIVRND